METQSRTERNGIAWDARLNAWTIRLRTKRIHAHAYPVLAQAVIAYKTLERGGNCCTCGKR